MMRSTARALLLIAALAPGALAVDSGASAATEVHEQIEGEEAAHGESHEGQTYFGIPAWVLKLINLVTFFGLLGYLLGGPIRNALSDRRGKIRRELAEAGERREKANRLAADIQARLDQMESEVEMILARATEEGERQKRELIEQGNTEAERILTQARSAVEAQLKQAKKELTDYAGQLAAERALSMLESNLTDADRRKLFAEGLEEIRS